MSDWHRCADVMPDHSGHFLVWDERDQHMWIAAYNDSGGQDTWGDPRPLGWAGMDGQPKLWPTHWAERPEPPK